MEALTSRGGTGELYAKTHADNKPEVETSVAKMLRVVLECHRGEDLEDRNPGMAETPERVARMWLNELASGYKVDVEGLFRLFPDEGYEGIVTVRDIPLVSTCEHHLLPITGYCHIGYIPDGQVVGLSKLPRVVNAFARRLQIQERLTHQITEAIDRYLHPKGAIVVISAEHSCMTARGIQAPGTRAVTSAVTGKFLDPEAGAREEFLNLVGIVNGGHKA